MITIFDGPDGGGKTRFAERWAKGNQYGAVTIHDHGPYLGDEHIAHHYGASLLNSQGSNIVMDRCWIAEPIYGRAYRDGTSRITVGHRRMLERLAWASRTSLGIFLPPFENCLKAFSSGREEYLDNPQELLNVYIGYQQLLDTHNDNALPFAVLDWSRQTHQMMCDLLEAVRTPPNHGPGIGRWARGEVALLIGEAPGSREGPMKPFVDWGRGGCSSWIAEHLELAGIPESRLYWVNVLNEHGFELQPNFIDSLEPATVVALGKVASEWCVGHRIDHERVNHPQFHKRFRSAEPYPLGTILREA